MKPKLIGLIVIISGCISQMKDTNFQILHREIVDGGNYQVIKDSKGCYVEFEREIEFDWFEDGSHFSSYNTNPDLSIIMKLRKDYCEDNIKK